MKKFKFICVVMAALMMLTACSNIVDVTEMASIGDTKVLKSEFNFYLLNAQSTIAQNLSAQGITLETEEDWQNNEVDGVPAAQAAKDEAVKMLRNTLVWEAKGKEAGFALDAEAKAEVETERNSLIESVGGRYAYEEFFMTAGVNPSDLSDILERSVYASKYQTKYTEEHAEELVSTPEDIQATFASDYRTVKHILVSNQAPEGTDAAAEDQPADYDALAKGTADDLYKQLKEGADFDKLMNEHSDDARDENGNLYSTSYTMAQDGSMVKEFEDAAFALEIGEISEPVQTTYGYHILTRVENPTEGEEYDAAIQKVEAAAQGDKLDKLVEGWATELGFKLNDKAISRIKIGK